MDLQIKLADDGYAPPYRSPEAVDWPDWQSRRWERSWRHGRTNQVGCFENRALLPRDRIPRSHAELLAALRADPASGAASVAHDPEPSASNFSRRSVHVTPQTWDLALDGRRQQRPRRCSRVASAAWLA